MKELHNVDCIEFMQSMADKGQKVDAIITDPPYLYLDHKLDKPFNEELFFELAGKITDKIVFFGRGDSFYKWNLLAKEQGFLFKEEIVWNKKHLSSPCHILARVHETISVRMKKGHKINKVLIDRLRDLIRKDKFEAILNDLKKLCSDIKTEDSVLNRYLRTGKMLFAKQVKKHSITLTGIRDKHHRDITMYNTYKYGSGMQDIVSIHPDHYAYEHPTQKPIELMRLLVKLVTSENETVLDPFMGGGSTGVACVIENRNFIGCEIDEEYFKIAKRRTGEYLF